MVFIINVRLVAMTKLIIIDHRNNQINKTDHKFWVIPVKGKIGLILTITNFIIWTSRIVIYITQPRTSSIVIQIILPRTSSIAIQLILPIFIMTNRYIIIKWIKRIQPIFIMNKNHIRSNARNSSITKRG